MSHSATHAHGGAHDHSSSHGHGHGHHGPDRATLLRTENITAPPAWGAGLSNALLGVGALGVLGTIIAAVTAGENPLQFKHAVAAYHVGVMSVLACALGAMFFVMVLHLTNAGWASTVRRQLENIMGMVPVALLLLVPVLVIELLTQGTLFVWKDPVHDADYLLQKKSPYLNTAFFYARFVLYAVVFVALARRLGGLSRAQDRETDPARAVELSRRARFTSSWGMLIFALATSFAAFDYLMGPDFRFFSTMWGVYYFSTAAYSGVATLILVLCLLLRSGRLQGVVTSDHFHDVGKLMFAFTVFWAYISFFQYFLYWYSNIPEETAWYLRRYTDGWQYLFYTLCFAHFVLPFLILLHRKVKRTPTLLGFMAGWALFAHVADIFWVVRPMVYARVLPADRPGPELWWIDVVGIAAAVGIFFGLLIRKVRSAPLVASNDPYMHEALAHKNVV